jgi:hypothetical protein
LPPPANAFSEGDDIDLPLMQKLDQHAARIAHTVFQHYRSFRQGWGANCQTWRVGDLALDVFKSWFAQDNSND